MFSQSKQSQPTFKFVIRSNLPSQREDDSELSLNNKNQQKESTDSTTSITPNLSTEHQEKKPPSEPVQSKPEMIINEEEKKRKRSDKDTNISLVSKRVYSHLERWQQKHDELVERKHIDSEQLRTASTADAVGWKDNSSNNEEDFSDDRLMACLLCNRKFKSKQDITRHQELSELHKKNSQNPKTVQEARSRLRQRNMTQETSSSSHETVVPQTSLEVTSSSSSSEGMTTYRNRAAERRQTYNQPELPQLKLSTPPTRPSEDHSKDSKMSYKGSSVSKPLEDSNIGAKMLKQMGWKKGQGLGKEGSGIVNPIEAQQRGPGGLGTTYSKIGSGGDSYKERAKELARRRLNEEL